MVIEIEKPARVRRQLRHVEDVRLPNSHCATASDGSSHVPGDTVPHPRGLGTFPRRWAVCTIDVGVPLEQVIQSATGLPADILRLTDRGYLKPGQFADVVVFDPKTTATATFEKPHQYATGVKYPSSTAGRDQNGDQGAVLAVTAAEK